MEKRISKTLSKISSDTRKANSQNISNLSSPSTQMFGKPGCPHCGGVGYLRADVPLGHEKFGRLEPCVCRANEIAQNARERLYELSNLERLGHLTFENFSRSGNPKAEFMSPQEAASLNDAYEASETFSKDLQGWLLLEGSYGAGKTHLAAAIANAAVLRGVPTLFITVPDLLDSLRFSFSDATTSFEARFDDIRNAALLVMDDFGTHNATPWAQEKLFQIINYRYINKLPTVITTNLILDEIESRIRSRLQDADFVKHVRITSSDYRRPKETSNPGISMLPSPELKGKTFSNFQSRENEIGKTDKIVTTSERRDSFGNKIKEKEITHISVTQADIDSLKEAAESAYTFALDPKGWFVLLGPPYCGKTHLAAAIGNYRLKQGGQAILMDVSDLLDYLKQTFNDSSGVSFNRRFYEIRNTPFLILDNLREGGSASAWAEDKLDQILSYRHNMHLPTVITSTMRPEGFLLSYPSIWEKILDNKMRQWHVINMPPYRRAATVRKPAAAKKGK